MLVDDHRIILWGLEKLIDGEKPRMKVVGKATSCTEAIDLADQVHPDVTLLDIDLSGQNGGDAIPKLISKSKAKVLVLTGLPNSSVHDSAVFAGARGVVHKEDAVETILKAIEKIHEGELWLDRITTGRIFVELSHASSPSREAPEKTKSSLLTTRERELISELATDPGANYRKISDKLRISEHTLHNHLTSIYSKLGIQNRLELFVYVQMHGLKKPSA